ncbi:MAG: 6-bladed beta-propeller [Balneola sp.]
MSSIFESSPKIEFKKDRVFQSNDDVLIGTIEPIYVDQKNRVFIGDTDQTRIHVFESNGEYLTSLGQEGRGPGDYSAISWRTTIISDSEMLYITDSYHFNPRRANVYTLDNLSFSHVQKLYPENIDEYDFLKTYAPIRLFPLKEGSFLVPYSRELHMVSSGEGHIYYLRQDKSGKILSKPIYKQSGPRYLIEIVRAGNREMEVMHTFPFHGSSIFAPSPNGNFYAAKTEEFKIDVLDSEGRYVRTIEKPFDNIPLNKEMLIKEYEETNYMPQLGDGVAVKMLKKADDLPTKWPALKSMLVDDEGRLWVSTLVDNTEIYKWWILKPSGEVISKLEWSRDKPIQQIRNGYLYTKEKDMEGADVVVRYSIKIEKN